MTSLNPASQPFFPGLGRKDSSVLLTGNENGSSDPNHSQSEHPNGEEMPGAFVTTPTSMGDTLAAGPPGEHGRSGSNYHSARSSPVPTDSSAQRMVSPLDSGGDVPRLASPPDSLGSPSNSSDVPPTQHNGDSLDPAQHPLSRSGFSDKSGTSSIPAIESFLRRERGPFEPFDGGGGAPKWDDGPLGGFGGGYGGLPPASSGPARGSGNRASTFGPIGKPVGELNTPPTSHGPFGPSLHSPIGNASRSMSLSLPVASPGGQMRKTSFAAFEQPYTPNHPGPPRSPLPNSFLNYTIGGGTTPLGQSATVTPTSNAFQNNPGLGPFSNAENMSSSPSSVRSMGAIEAMVNAGVGGGGGQFDSQAKSSPFINDLLDRLIRCEYSTSSIQREVGELNRKMSLLLDRLPAPSGDGGPPQSLTPTGNMYFQNGSSTSSLVRDKDDEIRQLNQRVATLTTSVSQLMQAQSHSQIQSMNANLPYTGTPELPNNAFGGRGDVVNRASPRAPVPIRTWSSGSMDMGPGMGNPGPIGRGQDIGVGGSSGGLPLLRGKRQSSVISLGRRDSAGTVMEGGGDWSNSRDPNGGPIITKWEQLPLSPDLLRSIAKYGVGPPNKIQQRALPFVLRGADIIAQAPPTQERIAAYVIPAIHVALTYCVGKPVNNRGPAAVIISTTVDQATQAQRMIRDLGGPIGVRSALGVGTGGDVIQELRLLQQSMPHILCGTPQKLHALFTTPNGLPGSEVRLLVLDEVDQLIARNLHDFVFNIVKLLPPPRSKPLPQNFGSGSITPVASPGGLNAPMFSPFDASSPSRRMSYQSSPIADPSTLPPERQTALFSNTVPQDVLNLANTIQLREPVRVLVRRDGNVANPETSHGSKGLRQFYLYLAFTGGGGARPDGSNAGLTSAGLGIIGSGRGSNLSSAETAQAREWKLDALADLLDDIEVGQAIVHVGGMTALDAVVYKLATRGLEAIPLHGDMSGAIRMSSLNKFRGGGSAIRNGSATRVLVVYDVQVKAPDVFQIPLVVNYDLPKAVEEYALRVAPAISNNYSRSGIVINFVTATGGDVEMLRSIECFYKIKCPEVPVNLRDIL